MRQSMRSNVKGVSMIRKSYALSVGAMLICSSVGLAQYVESEPNETKATATLVNGMLSGEFITGNTIGTSTTVAGAASADTYRIKTGPAALGIYRHDLVITTTGTAGHGCTIRGLNQSAGVAGTTDSTVQTSSTTTVPARMSRWYGFGKGEEIFWRATGGAATTADYTATLTSTPIVPTNIGSYTAGNITITTVGQIPAATGDTDLWVYDSNFNAIPGFGNDDEFGTTSFQSRLTRNFAPGTYYLALTAFQLATNQTAPADDDFKSGTLLDFPDALAHSSSLPTTATPAAVSLNFSVIDACGSTSFLAAKTDSYGIVWFCFTVNPAVPPWETNDAAAELSLDGLQNTGTSGPISVAKCIGQFTRMYLNSTKLGSGWDLLLTSAPLVPAGPTCGASGIRTTGGQAVNLDVVGNPGSISSLNGPFWWLNPWAGNLFFPLNSAVPFGPICAQFLILDPAHPDGYSLSAANCLRYDSPTTLAGPVAGPASDDSSVTVNVGCVPFFFQSFSQMHVSSNGRVTFGSSDASFLPVVTSTTTGPGWFGHWLDLNPSVGPAANVITVDSPAANVFRVHYETVVVFGTPDTITTDLILDANTGSLTITGLSTIPALNVDPIMVGVSKGGAGGTDPGATVYALGGPNAPGGPNAAIYALDSITNVSAALLGINTIRFDVITSGPNCGGYEWTALP